MSSKKINPNLKNLNPIFHKRRKSEDECQLPRSLIIAARKSGLLNLAGKSLSTVPDKVWNLNSPEMDEVDVNLDMDSHTSEDAWWNHKPLSYLDLSSNALSSIPVGIENLIHLTVLNLLDNALTTLPKEIGKLTNLSKINLSRNKISKLPQEFYNLKELKYFNLSHNSMVELNPSLTDLYMLEILDLSHNQLTSLPGGIGFLVRLTEINLCSNKLSNLPNDIVNLRYLQKLDVMKNEIEYLPPVMGELRKLEFLYAQHNNVQELPDFRGCEHLKEIHISNNFIKEIKADFCEGVPQLKTLDLRDNKIEKLPDEIAMLQSLIRLDLSNNSINSLPNSLATLAHLISLQVDGNPIRSIRRDIIQCGTNRILKTLKDRCGHDDDYNKFSHFGVNESDFPDRYKMRRTHSLAVTMRDLIEIPENVFIDAKNEQISIIDLSKNKFKKMPEGLVHVASITTDLNLSQNLLSKIPLFITQFVRIAHIDISKNHIEQLPPEFGILETLRELNISNNRLTNIPNCIYQLSRLEILLLRENKIEKIDPSSTGLGAMKKLTTLDLANNSIDHVPPELGSLKNIKSIDLIGNRFRQPRHQVLVRGTDAIMSYLRDRIPL